MRLLLFLFILISFNSYTQIRITRAPDINHNLHLYKVIKVPVISNGYIDHWVYWMAEDLEPPETISNIMDMKTQEDQEGIGRFVNGSFDSLTFNYNGAMKACPVGWKIPTIKDWDTLLNTLSNNQRISFFNVLNVSKEIKSDTLCGNIIKKEIQLKGGYYWSSDRDLETAWRIEIDPRYYNVSKGKSQITDFLLVRCMKYDEED